jgi:hypothetical protein
MHNKATFLAAAIADTQATIRAIDVKVAAILVGLLAPLQNLHRVFAHLENFAGQSPRWAYISASVAFVICWLLALFALVRAIAAIDNPAKHIINNANCNGVFFAGGLYGLKVSDAFLNRDEIKASKDPVSFAALLPTNDAEIERELVFEHMKLAYIRDVKMHRLKWGVTFSILWIVVGVAIYLASKYVVVLPHPLK